MVTSIGGFNNNGPLPQSSNQDLGLGGLISSWKKPDTSAGGVTSVPSSASNPYGIKINAPAPQPIKSDSGITGSPNITYPGTNTYEGMIPSTPVKKITATDGTTTEFHAPAVTTPTPTQANPVEQSAPVNKTQPGTIGNNGTNFQQNLANTQTSGQQTQNENQTQTGVLNAGRSTPEENYWKNQYQNAVAGTQFGQLAPYAEAGMNVGKTPEQLQGLITAPDLAGRAAGDTGLYKALGSAYGNAALAGLTASQTDAARALQANTTAYSGAQTQAGRATGANESVQGATAPQYGIQYGTQVGNPGQPNGGIDTNSFGGVAAPANIKSVQDYTTQINTTQKSVDTLGNLANQIVPNIGTTGFNPLSSPIGNQTFAQYFTEKNPAAKAGITAGLGELKNQISNVISSATGLTPTGVTAVTDSYDLTTLNPEQLHDFLEYINQYAKSNMDAAQKSIDRIKSGGSVASNPGLLPSPQENSTAQAALGTGANLAKGLIGKVTDQLGNAVAGLTAGSAAAVLK